MHNELTDGTVLVEGKKVLFSGNRFEYVRHLGSGGTGSTELFRDPVSGLLFAFKKFDPIEGNDREDCFRRFVEEAAILMQLSHRNIVRVYTYYLYEKSQCGYLQMEYIEGAPIDEYEIGENGLGWDEVFLDVVSAFEAMEEKQILHRDIRPSNILISNEGIVKIIDFGFGKQYETESTLHDKSISLNWPYPPPHELIRGVYDHATEVYYVGCLFRDLINAKKITNFSYGQVISKMTEIDPDNRLMSFSDVENEASKLNIASPSFSYEEKYVYRFFADRLVRSIVNFTVSPNIAQNVDGVLQGLKNVLEESMLEEYVQSNYSIIQCFVPNTGLTFDGDNLFRVDTVEQFYNFLRNVSEDKQIIILRNIATRLKRIEVVPSSIFDEDIPF